MKHIPQAGDSHTGFVFIIGTGRSGSTLVHQVLATHPDTGFISRIDDHLAALDLKGRWNKPAYQRLPPSLAAHARFRWGPTEGYKILKRHVSPLVVSPCRDLTEDDATPWLSQRFQGFFERRAYAQAAQVFLQKFTGWPRARFIYQIFPDARFINVVRDGRAVASSFLQMPWWDVHRGPSGWAWGPLPEAYAAEWESSGRSFVVLTGIAWKMFLDAADTARDMIPATQWMDVRYEDVIADPRGGFDKMATFAGLDWNTHVDRSLQLFRFSGSRLDSFRRDLGPRDLELLEASLASHLQRNGYDLSRSL